MIIVKKELLMKNEIPIMDGIAKIKRCKSSNIWQFSMWIKKDKKYYKQKVECMQPNSNVLKTIVDIVLSSKKATRKIKDLMKKKIKLILA